MSDYMLDALLDGNGPKYPLAIAQLNTVVDPKLTTEQWEKSAKKIPEFTSLQGGRQTSDGYYWELEIHFNINGSLLVILIPYTVKDEKGTKLDRSAAIYIFGKVTNTKQEKIVGLLAAQVAPVR